MITKRNLQSQIDITFSAIARLDDKIDELNAKLDALTPTMKMVNKDGSRNYCNICCKDRRSFQKACVRLQANGWRCDKNYKTNDGRWHGTFKREN